MSSDKYKFKNVTYVSNSDVSIFSFHFLVCNIKLTLIYSPNTHTHMYIYAHTCTQFTNKHTHLLEMENQTINPQLLGTNQQPSSTTKVERRLIEKKNRRNQMKILYSKLNSQGFIFFPHCYCYSFMHGLKSCFKLWKHLDLELIVKLISKRYNNKLTMTS